MTVLAVVKSQSGVLIAATDEDRVKLRAVRPGEAIVIRFGKPRSIERHKQFFKCATFVWKHHPDYRGFDTVEPLVEVLKQVTRHVVTWTLPSTGEVYERTRSIAFTELDEGEFLSWVQRAKPYLLELMEQIPERTKARHGPELDGWTHWCLH